MGKIWGWLKKWGAWLIGGLVTLLTFGFIFRKHWREKLHKRDLQQLEDAENQLAYLNGLRDEITERAGEEDQAIQSIDEQIEKQRERIRETMQLGAGLSAEEIAREFDDAGY